jgi:hypothetical protein
MPEAMLATHPTAAAAATARRSDARLFGARTIPIPMARGIYDRAEAASRGGFTVLAPPGPTPMRQTVNLLARRSVTRVSAIRKPRHGDRNLPGIYRLAGPLPGIRLPRARNVEKP